MKQHGFIVLLSLAVGSMTVYNASVHAAMSDEGTRGNWRKKSEFYQDAKAALESMPPILAELEAEQEPFNAELQNTKAQLKSFHERLALQRFQYDELAKSVNAYISELETSERAQIAEQGNAIELEDSAILQRLSAQRTKVNELIEALKEVTTFDAALASYKMRLDEVIESAKQTIVEAENLCAQIEQTLDHRHAEVLYYAVRSHLETLEQILNYVRGEFSDKFHEVTQLIALRLEAANSKIDELEEQEIFIRNRFERLAQIKQDRLLAQQAKNRAATPASMKWYDYLLWPFRRVWSVFFGKS